MERGMISVDDWSSGSQVYFLTSLRRENIVGLSSTWRHGFLYCSRITAELIRCEYPGFDHSLIRVLEIGTWHALCLTSPSSGAVTRVKIMAIDAQHCPGSVMYLFSTESSNTLCTGDFRWESNGEGTDTASRMLINSLKNKRLDYLYLDNTYCNPKYEFPPRKVAAKRIVDIIASHPNDEVIIAVDSLGKEDLLLYIARELDIKICVWPERLEVMHQLGYRKYFTTQTSLTRVRAVPRYSFSFDTLEGLNEHRCSTIGILPSGLPKIGNVFASYSNKSGKTADSDYIYVVPYSDHSCYSEIAEFVELLRPVNVEGIASRVEPRKYFSHLCGLEQATWRINLQKLVNGEVVDKNEEDETKPFGEVTSTVPGKKRKAGLVDFVRTNRVDLMRRSSRGAKIADSDEE